MQFVMRSILKYKSKISEHGVFPLVSVQVWHGEPGNMHPYNFEPISFAKTYFGQIIVRNPKTANSKTVQHEYLNVLDDFGTNKGQCPVQKTFGILIVLTQRSIHQPVRVRVRIPVPTHVMNKALISKTILQRMVSYNPKLTIL